MNDFVAHESYSVPSTGNMKCVTYFLACYENQTPVYQQQELTGIALLPFNAAMKRFQFESSRRILKKAWSFLQRGAGG